MRKLLILCLLLFTAAAAYAQPYGNEWINHSQRYLKVKINTEGIYRIDSAAFANALAAINESITSVDPRGIQVFGRGQEQYIYVNGESDGVFNTGDFIEFYAQRNDGFLDRELYGSAALQPNPYLSIINDTATYFITWNNQDINNNRLTIEVDTTIASISNYTAEPYFWKESFFIPNADYYLGATNSVGSTSPMYDKAEGWFDWPAMTLGNTSGPKYLWTGNAFTTGPNASAELVFAGRSKHGSVAPTYPDHNLVVRFSPDGINYTQIVDTVFHGYELVKLNRTIAPSQLASTLTEFRYTSDTSFYFTTFTPTASVVISHIKLKYPHTMTVENNTTYKLIVPNSTTGLKARLNLTDFISSNTTPFLYDLHNQKRIYGAVNGNNFTVLVPNSATNPEKTCFLASDASVISLSASALKPVNSTGSFVDYNQQAQSSDSAFVIVSHKKLWSKALDYKTYRASSAGGSHEVIVADVDDLYDQFTYGINKNPLAIRRFAELLLDTCPTVPQNLFLVGKALSSSYSKLIPSYWDRILVPTYGYPGSDVLLTGGLNGSDSLVPAIPTGRLSAEDDFQVDWYLRKAMQFDTTAVAAWKKRILHFAGGSTSNEQSTFQGYLKSYEDTLENVHFGGNVITFKKTSSAPIQINQSDSLRDLIEGGVSMLTFFGHASGTGFDQSMDHPENYNNLGRYPLLLANSCYAGDIHGPSLSSSESFVLIEDKGVIGYIASVSLGVPYALDKYSSQLVRNIARQSYGKSIGWCMKQAISANMPTIDYWTRMTCMEMTLHGDPSVVIGSPPLPEYVIKNSDVKFDLNYRPDSFIVYASVANIGKAIRDTIMIEFKRKFPNGDVQVSLLAVTAPLNQSTYSVKLAKDFAKGPGLNTMQVSVDFTDQVDEGEDVLNNSTSQVPFLIRGNDIIPVYPYKYAVVPNSSVTLKASTGDPFAPARNYVFQLDTTDLFNSSQLKTTVINSAGGVVEWTPPPIYSNDSTVYFWRVSPDSTDATGYSWKESSFQLINGEHGWGQAHFFQFKNDEYEFVKQNRTTRQFEFVNDVKLLRARNFIYSYLGSGTVMPEDMQYSINNSVMKSWSCVWPGGVNIAVFDPVSTKPWVTASQTVGLQPYGNWICWPGTYYAFDIADFDTTWRERIRNFLDTIPTGHKVLVYSIDVHNTSQYSNALYEAFDSIGSANIRNIADTVPYIIFGEKGALPGTAQEVIGTHKTAIIDLEDTLRTNWNVGYIASEIIGPATSWNRLSWRQTSLEPNSEDSIRLNVIGIKANGDQVVLAVFPPDSMDVPWLGAYVNAATYPYLKLVAYQKDDSLRTPPQLKRWHVMYTPMPEAAVDPDLGFSFYNDTVQEGENVVLHLPVQNISQYAFNDSIVFTYWLEDRDHIIHPLPYKMKKKPFSPGEIIIDTLTLNTTGYAGLNTLWVEVNPVNHVKSQQEQYHFNNLINISFLVGTDKINPLLDVTFDGVHILNRDIVSAKPNIMIQLKDENRFLALNDSSDFKVFIKSPSQTVQQEVSWGPELSFTPAVLPKNSCKLNYTPAFIEDGVYELIVQAKDKSDNQSGSIDYRIEFEVVNKPSITSVLNYPNPFSTSTKFVFTLTGSEVPSYFKIQIMTVTGKVVREIDGSELGNIHIGRNITEYAWDGKDEFGDQLANGIYLYRIMTQLNGNEIEKRETNADQYFTKGFGKMYLIR
jgi:hypothetical protein